MIERDTSGQEQAHSAYPVTIFSKTKKEWQRIRPVVNSLVLEEFPLFWDAHDIRRLFWPKTATSALLYTSEEKLIGFSSAYRDYTTEKGKTAYVAMTILDKQHRGRRLVGHLISNLEDGLRKDNYEYLRRDARTDNGYADAIKRHYGERILFEHPTTTTLNEHPKTFFSIKL
jgi:Acetyltransferase (GNAT) family